MLEHIFRSNDRLPATVIVPPGDDMAALEIGKERLLVAVDQLVGGRHVDLAKTPLSKVGYKAVARSVSDIAAMAAEPIASLVAVTLPRDFGEDRAQELFEAMRAAAHDLNVPLIGGDIAVHASSGHPMVCSVTVLARAVDGQPIITRSGAKVGDRVCVTGALGGAYRADGSGRHLEFVPRVKEALALLGELGANLHAMIDISDGLGRDAGHIAAQSGVAIEIQGTAVPCYHGCNLEQAISDGEDYELCFACSGEPPRSVCNVAVTPIGRVIDPVQHGFQPGDVLLRTDDGCLKEINEEGWEHR